MAFPASQALIVLGLDHHHHKQNQHHEQTDLDIDNHHNDTPIRFLPLRHVYSATSPCVTASGSSNIISKKVKARKLVMVDEDPQPPSPTQMIEKVPLPLPLPLPLRLPPVTRVYCRRRFRRNPDEKTPFLGSLVEKVEPEELGNQVGSIVVKDEPVDEGLENEFSGSGSLVPAKKKRRVGSSELEKLGVDSSVGSRLERRRLRESRNHCNANKSNSEIVKKVRRSDSSATRENQECLRVRKWVPLEFDGVDPMVFIGFQCKVYWPLDDAWYQGSVIAYNAESNQHNVKYDDGDEETLILSQEKIKFCVSHKDMQRLNLKVSHKCMVNDDLDYGELLVLAATLDDCRELEPGDIIWAKLTGHSMWPAVIMDESRVGDRKGLGKCSGGRSVPVQFFGSHDFARIQLKQIVSFLRGLLSSFHLKCKSPNFLRGLREAKNYLNEQKLPNSMLHLQHKSEGDDHGSEDCEDDLSIDSDEAYMGDDDIKRTDEGFRTSPLKPGDLRIVSLGKIVKDSDNFCEGRTVWPLGYTAVRKFASIRDPSSYVFYKMEVLRDPESKSRPLFKITVDGEQFRGATPSACWNKIYKRIKKMQSCDAGARCVDEMLYPSGSEMFGFTNSEVVRRIQGLTNSKPSPKSSGQKVFPERYQNMPVGYRPVRIDWKDLDRCNVCHMDEEYENNLFLQCDKCRMMVHARCYGEECVDGVIWLCNLCRSEAPVSTPPCCLCPVIGGAMKPTTDGRWAHLACAIWIPETCLSDIKKMEPIDGLNRINKDRWKLLCSICGVPYGACIQCSNYNCRVAYHPLCARAAGLCVELEDEDKLHLISVDDDEEEQCIRLLSFCKKHKQPSNDRPLPEEWLGQNASQDSSYDPPPNQSGCARCEPYDYFGRRGRKEPEVLAAASVKRLFVENQPYLVGGYCLHDSLVNISSVDNAITGSKFSFSLQKQITMNLDASPNILSMAEKYKYMRETFRKRLAFGKSRIHGFGIFAKQPHKAGDMMIEYTGELVRPSVADRREHFIYNSLVGAGTYMFRVDDERVIDATRAGSIAHLINHSCEPNCYSRVITVNGDEHIIIFAKRDIKQWEELTYDYRFFSIDEQLACYCGFPRCRGVVNDVESEEQVAKLYVPRSELIEWRGE